jgi:hypothetical protein
LADIVSPGDYVLAAGSSGVLSVIFDAAEMYIAGSTPVNLRGVVTSVDPARATLSVGGVTVDYSTYLVSDPSFEPRTNESIEVSGIQPVAGGTIIANGGYGAVVKQTTVQALTPQRDLPAITIAADDRQ